jgi:hypothetical protein
MDQTFTLAQRERRIFMGWITYLTCWPVVPRLVKMPSARGTLHPTGLGTIDQVVKEP